MTIAVKVALNSNTTNQSLVRQNAALCGNGLMNDMIQISNITFLKNLYPDIMYLFCRQCEARSACTYMWADPAVHSLVFVLQFLSK